MKTPQVVLLDQWEKRVFSNADEKQLKNSSKFSAIWAFEDILNGTMPFKIMQLLHDNYNYDLFLDLNEGKV